MQQGPHHLKGRRVLVTGGSSGIGAAAAAALRGAGAAVALTGRSERALAEVAARCERSSFLAADLCSPGAAGTVVKWAAKELGGLDTLVCAAGSGWLGPFAEMPEEEIDALIDLNLRAPLHTVRAALPALLDSPCGGIVLVGSIVGLVGVPQEVAYSSAKAGLAGFADALRLEVGSRLAVSLVSPGAVDTPFFARRNRPYERRWPRPMPVERAAGAVLHAVATGEPSMVVPSWMGVAARLHGAAPGLYRALARRFG